MPPVLSKPVHETYVHDTDDGEDGGPEKYVGGLPVVATQAQKHTRSDSSPLP
ncbi:hypothetical protein FRC10_005608, partial [Ceratobasidium sp. 414]